MAQKYEKSQAPADTIQGSGTPDLSLTQSGVPITNIISEVFGGRAVTDRVLERPTVEKFRDGEKVD